MHPIFVGLGHTMISSKNSLALIPFSVGAGSKTIAAPYGWTKFALGSDFEYAWSEQSE